ncbi:MAG: hypothetical protein ACOCTU_07025 [Bacteroidota bacterium]
MINEYSTGEKNENVQMFVNPYGRIDGTEGITKETVSLNETGSKHKLNAIFISLPNSTAADVVVKNMLGKTKTVEFQPGLNPVPVKEIVADPDNPAEIDIFY